MRNAFLGFFGGRGAPVIGTWVWTFAAYCRNSLDGQWYSYDDSTVEPLPEDEVNSRGAYILFYQKRNSIPLWSASSSLRGRCRSVMRGELGGYAVGRRGPGEGGTDPEPGAPPAARRFGYDRRVSRS